MEYDLHRYFPHLRLTQLDDPHGPLTWRLLGVILSNLPMDSVTATRLRDTVPPTHSPDDDPTDMSGQRWDLANYQLQGLRNDIAALAASLGGGEPPDPLPIPKYRRPRADKKDPLAGYDQAQIDRLRRVRQNRGWETNG